MALITLLDAQLAFGHVALLDHADFSLESNQRIGLIGRNGTGKSSLLKILAGLEKPDDGILQLQQNLRHTTSRDYNALTNLKIWHCVTLSAHVR